ncbi:Acyl-CoA carboxylase epsilon subunit [Actinosynnema pretiosum]|nr:Acyl-CoA carboxylase epsilon subunit [Actinosynnema pretiosum]
MVRGNPTEEELAALVAVLTAVAARRAAEGAGAGSGSGSAEREASRWADRSRLVRQPLGHGPGAWRASGFPR